MALAEKIDKLTGFWAIDEKPTGSKDPFALRRAALGVIRILVENDLPFSVIASLRTAFDLQPIRQTLFSRKENLQSDLEDVSRRLEKTIGEGTILGGLKSDLEVEKSQIESDVNSAFESLNLYNSYINAAPANLLVFLHDRLKVYLKDQGIRHDIIDACISIPDSAPAGATPQNDDLTLLVKRAKALSETLKTDDGENLIQGFKRANNILSQAEEADGVEYSYGADVKFAETDEERALFTALDEAEAKITPAMAKQDFSTAMSAMATLRGPIDAFFDTVQVNSDKTVVRRNRLNLLSRIRTICTSVADLTKVDG